MKLCERCAKPTTEADVALCEACSALAVRAVKLEDTCVVEMCGRVLIAVSVSPPSPKEE